MRGFRKNYLLATVSIVALAGAMPAAMAADLTPKAPPVVMPSMTWTGFYAGVHGGVVRHEATSHDLDGATSFFVSTGPLPFPGSVTTSATGGLAGGHVGYNWQSRNFVFGVEADFAGTFGTDANVTFGAFGGVLNQVVSSELKWLSTFRVRAGLDVNGTLVFVTAGAAVANVKSAWSAGFIDGTIPPVTNIFQDDSIRIGWAAGGGIEHRFGSNWSARLEAMFVDLGKANQSKTVVQSSSTADFGTFRAQWENTAIIARGGVTYHF
jgi:outer membrane immunogenic protein